MPISKRPQSDVPQHLRPYSFHGLDLSIQGSHAVGDCPFCGRKGKFSVSVDTGLWRCFVCGSGTAAGGGNALVFLRLLHEQRRHPFVPEFAAEVVQDRRLLDVATVAAWGICRAADGAWLVPGYGADGRLDQLYRRTFMDGSWRLLPTPGIWPEGKVHALHAPGTVDAASGRVDVFEGPWDGMAYWELRPEAACVVAVPGCNVWRDEWTALCRGKHVTLWFDSDYPRGSVSGKVFRAGYDGMARIARRLSGHAASVRYLRWGPDGFDPDKPSGWDVRDHLNVLPSQKRAALAELSAKVADAPAEWLVATPPTNGQVRAVESQSCSSWVECVGAWYEAMRMRQDIADALAVLLAVCASTQQAGNQLFLDLVGNAGSGKCLGEGTPVLMHDGYIKNVEDIVVGDMLIGPDSKPRTVTSISSGEEELYVVDPTKGDQYVVNESHILSLKMSYKSGGYGKDDTANISVRDYIGKDTTFKTAAKGWRSGVEWSERIVEIDPYFLGVWLGDGHSAGLRITTKDVEVMQSIKEYGQKLGVHVRQYHQGNEVYIVSIANGRRQENILHRKMVRLGLLNNKHIPQIYKANSKRVRLELLAGLLDTDGSLSGSGFDYISKNESLARDAAFIARSVGLAAYITETIKWCTYKGEKVSGTYWRVSISGDCSIVPTRIPRKKAGKRRQKKDALRTGVDLYSVGVGKYYGFTLDGDGLFLLGDFTVTHNTTLCEGLLVSSHCHHLEHLTGFHSGWKMEGDSDKDCSPIARMNGKTLVTAEFDIMRSSPKYQELMGQTRRIFDGKSGATYKNTDKDVLHVGLRTPWIRAGTPAIMDTDQASMGDRFMRFIIPEPDTEDEKRAIIRQALRSERVALLETANGTAGSLVDPKTRRAQALTGGYVDWLRDNAERLLSQVDVSEAAEDRCIDLAEMSADMRARPNEDKRKVEVHDSKELPTRLARQNVRLAACLAVVLNKREVDGEVLRICRKVALDTAFGQSLDIARWLCSPNPKVGGKPYQECGGLSVETLAMWSGMTPERLHKYLMFLRKVGVLEWRQARQTNGLWVLTERSYDLYLRVMGD